MSTLLTILWCAIITYLAFNIEIRFKAKGFSFKKESWSFSVNIEYDEK